VLKGLLPVLNELKQLDNGGNEANQLLSQVVDGEGREELHQLLQMSMQMEGDKLDEGEETALAREKLASMIKQMSPNYLEELID
jgi:hypothetical protein